VTFRRHFTVRFRHCDPAGIVFYPRYFEMMNDVLEDFLAELGAPFAAFGERDVGVPTVALEATFARPSFLGDALTVEMTVARLGESSFALAYTGSCAGEERFTAKSTLVYASNRGKNAIHSLPLPEGLRTGMSRYLSGETS
jgi:4-hydroxybenzoyl-CoA thioesterase